MSALHVNWRATSGTQPCKARYPKTQAIRQETRGERLSALVLVLC
jgi:hypothetical protein